MQPAAHERELDRPIIVLGAARSGTTLLAETLARHPHLAYASEPRHIWRRGNAYRQSDVLHPEDATPELTAFIRGQFARIVRSAGRKRLLEKTPSNALRMPFVLSVLPDARVIHVLRDGRDVAFSATKEWAGLAGDSLDAPATRVGGALNRIRRIMLNQGHLFERLGGPSDWLEFPAHLALFASVVTRTAFHPEWLPWGPRFPGIAAVRRAYSLIETCAIQWEVSVRLARSACMTLPRHQYVEVRYEKLVADPKSTLKQVLEFADVPADAALLGDLASGVVGNRSLQWPRAVDPATVRRLEALIGSTLVELGYPVTRADRPTREQAKSNSESALAPCEPE